MALQTLLLDESGNHCVSDGQQLAFDTMTNARIAGNLQPSIVTGTGAPTFTAAQGSMYIRRDGGVNTRIYINTTGSTTWTAMTNAA